MSKRTGNRNGREAKKRSKRIQRKLSRSWHRRHICLADGTIYPVWFDEVVEWSSASYLPYDVLGITKTETESR